MAIFSNIKNTFRFFLEDDDFYGFACMESNKMLSIYSIRVELNLSLLWNFLIENLIESEEDVLFDTNITYNDKNKIIKTIKYVIKCHLNKYFKNKHYGDYIYILLQGSLIDDVNTNVTYYVLIYYDPQRISTNELEETIVKDLMNFAITSNNNNNIYVITRNSSGFGLIPYPIKEIDVDLELNYGSKFLSVHENIVRKLKDETSGLFIFYGEPGTGKTTYIRKLINILGKEKLFIYVPSYLINDIVDPEFTYFISENTNTIIILEDAENVLTSSPTERTQSISNILNITDGLLNDFLKIQIIATFNTNEKIIDPALKRSGRLKMYHKFDKLSVEDANKLASKLGLNKKFNTPMTLAEIYHYNDNNGVIEEINRKIGF